MKPLTALYPKIQYVSPLTEGRGLKQMANSIYYTLTESPLTKGRGLKRLPKSTAPT